MLDNTYPDIKSGRTILLLGSPRSGTSWLAKILDTYENVLYVHEPLQRCRGGYMQRFIHRVWTEGELADEERRQLLTILRQPQFESLRPPFFRKKFLKRSPRVLTVLWLLRRMFHASEHCFRFWTQLKQQASFDLLIKEVDWLSHADKLVKSLQPERLIFIIRHPCGVVHSRLRGLQMGVIYGHDRKEWLDYHAAEYERLGYSPATVEKMSLWEFYALDWVLQNQQYYTIAQKHACVSTVHYWELCRDPLAVTERLFSFLGWQLGAETTRFIKTSTHLDLRQSLLKRFWRRRYYYGLYKNPRESATAWMRELTADQQKAILAIAHHFEAFETCFSGSRTDDYHAQLQEASRIPLSQTNQRSSLHCSFGTAQT